MNASYYTMLSPASAGFGTFPPIIDGVYVQDRPEVQLAQNRVNGERLLVGVRCPSSPRFSNMAVVAKN